MTRILPNRGRWLLLLAAVFAIGLLAIACGGDDKATATATGSGSPAAAGTDKKVTIGFLYVGAVDDGGYNQAAYQGQQAVEKLPGVKVIKAENVPESAEAERRGKSSQRTENVSRSSPSRSRACSAQQ